MTRYSFLRTSMKRSSSASGPFAFNWSWCGIHPFLHTYLASRAPRIFSHGSSSSMDSIREISRSSLLRISANSAIVLSNHELVSFFIVVGSPRTGDWGDVLAFELSNYFTSSVEHHGFHLCRNRKKQVLGEWLFG